MKTPQFAVRALALAALVTSVSAPAATLVLRNVDAAGVGFNDPTPAEPVGGNSGTTVGEQRLIAYQRALDLWGSVLQSEVPIVVRGSFAALSCTATGGTLASAGAVSIFANFANAPFQNRWYGGALADSLAGTDLNPGADDIVANFNGNVGTANCISGPGWYYGLDNAPPAGAIDFLNTFMHEVSHGLGFQNFANEANGTLPNGLADVYMNYTLDLDRDKTWDQLTGSEIIASAINTGRVVWSGERVNTNAPFVLGPLEGINVSGTVFKELEYGTAAFGPAVGADNFGGDVVLTSDAGGASTTDGCEAIANDVAGKVALVDRGTCGFAVKVKNAQNAGASAVIVANTTSGVLTMGGTDATIVIPSVLVSLADGNLIKGGLPGVQTSYFIDPTRQSGTSEGLVRLYAPGVVALGSSISHFDTTASPNLLMEPSITSTLRAATNIDLTPALMEDIGWELENLVIEGCDTGVPNALGNGDLLSVAVDACASGASNGGAFKSCVSAVTNEAKAEGLLAGAQKGAIQSCAAKAG